MPFYKPSSLPGQLQFITSSTCRRAKLFDSERFRKHFTAGAHMPGFAVCAISPRQGRVVGFGAKE